MASKHIKHAEEEIKKYGATVDEQAQAKIDETTTQYDERIAAAEREARELEKKTTDDYISAINAIDLQKALDIKDIQETRANMGLSRSGVSATEQTAAVLAAGNRSNAANLQRQKAIDSLTKSLSDYKIQQGDQLRSDILSINESANKAKADYAANLYEKAYDAEATEVETQRKADEAALKERRDSLDSAFKYLSDDEKRQYLPLYMQAIDGGLNGTQFLSLVSSEGARLKNESELKTLLDEKKITPQEYESGVKNGLSANQVLEAKTKAEEQQNKIVDAQPFIDILTEETKGQQSLVAKSNQQDSLIDKVVNDEIPVDAVLTICEQLGLNETYVLESVNKQLAKKIQERASKFQTDNEREEHIAAKNWKGYLQVSVDNFKNEMKQLGRAGGIPYDSDLRYAVSLARNNYGFSKDDSKEFLKAVGFTDKAMQDFELYWGIV